ncbi:MAG: SDR family NAD(P)-dependent oxidoreductase [Patescibacteria group bacterium]
MDGKVVVITGALGGIGEAVRDIFYRDALVKHITSIDSKKSSLFVCCDVTNFSDVIKVINYAAEFEKRIDILVNAAGALPKASPVIKMDMEEARKVMEVNLWGTWNCCKAVLPIMRAQRYGRIVNISSVAGQRGDPGNAIYAASKAAIESLTKSLALEAVYCKEGETPPNITVNAVAPGIVDTPMTANLSERAFQEYLKRNPLKRKIKPEEVAEAVYFLATASSAINGVILPVDGGYLAS